MRFIIGFIFFGILFYAIWLYLPDTFETLVSAAANLFNFLKDWFQRLTSRVGTSTEPTTPARTLLSVIFDFA